MTIDRSSGMYRCTRRGIGCTWAGIGIDSAETEVSLRALRRLTALAAADPGDPRVIAVANRWMARTSPQQEAERTELEAALQDVLARRDDLADARFVRGTLPAETYDRLATVLTEEVRAVTERLATLPAVEANMAALMDLTISADDPDAGPLAPGSAWGVLPAPTRRGILGSLVEGITVGPRGAADRLTLAWVGDA